MVSTTSELLVEGVLMFLVALIGVFLNISSVFYFSQLRHQRAFHRLLLTLALMDTLHLIASAFTFSVANLSYDYASHAWHYIVPYSLPIAQSSMTGSVYLTISLTVERYFSVVKPFYQMRNRWLRSSMCLAFPGIIFSLLFTLPNYFMLKTVFIEDPVLKTIPMNETFLFDLDLDEIDNSVTNITTISGPIQLLVKDSVPFQVIGFASVPAIQFADFRSNGTYITIYVMWLHLIFNTIIPFIILLALNIAIYKRLVSLPQNISIRRTAEGNLRRRELRLARISLLIVIIFIICHSLKIFPSLFEILGYPPELIPGILPLSHLLLTINCSVNFLVYYLASGRALSKLLPTYSAKSWPSDNPTLSLINTQYSEVGPSSMETTF